MQTYSYTVLNDDGVLVQAASMKARDDQAAVVLGRRLEASDAIWLTISRNGRIIYQGAIKGELGR